MYIVVTSQDFGKVYKVGFKGFGFIESKVQFAFGPATLAALAEPLRGLGGPKLGGAVKAFEKY